jgi:tetratricopeptide (TPR) repeat protein
VGKSKPVDANSGQRQVTRKVKGQGQVEVPPVTESNAAVDKKARLLCVVLGIGFSSLLLLGLLLSGQQLYISITKGDALGIFFGAAGAIVTILLGRALLWLTFLLPIIYASKNNAWEAEESISRRALKLRRLVPTAGSTAAVMLIQNYIKRGEFEQALTFGETQWEENQNDKKYVQALAPVFSGVALSCQTKGNWKDSIIWNDRAIAAFEAIQQEMGSRKGFMAKLASQQDAQVSGSVKTQLALSTFSNGNCNFNLRNFRAAKEHYRKAVDLAMRAPEGPEKNEIIRVAKEQLSRLKHA